MMRDRELTAQELERLIAHVQACQRQGTTDADTDSALMEAGWTAGQIAQVRGALRGRSDQATALGPPGNAWAVASLILGLCTLLTLGLAGPLALWTGITSKRRNENSRQATAGIVLGAVGCAFMALVGVSLLVAQPTPERPPVVADAAPGTSSVGAGEQPSRQDVPSPRAPTAVEDAEAAEQMPQAPGNEASRVQPSEPKAPPASPAEVARDAGSAERDEDETPYGRERTEREARRQTTGRSKPTVAAMLLVIDGGYPYPGPPAGHPALAPYEELLREATKKTKSSEQEVGDQTVKATEILRDEGIRMSCREVMENVVASVPEGAEGLLEYSEVAAAWVVLVNKE